LAVAGANILYKADAADQLLIEPLDAMTLVYHRRSAITHMVAEPVPEMLAAMGGDAVDAATLVARLLAQFDLGAAGEAEAVIAARLEELADLGLVERVRTSA
jgi:PqqD family protein of HPr-rel-A system